MQTHKQIIQLLKWGYNVDVKDNDGDFRTFTPDKYVNGYYVAGCWRKSQKEARESLRNIFYSKENIESHSKLEKWQIVGAWTHDPEEQLKVGQKVRINSNGIEGKIIDNHFNLYSVSSLSIYHTIAHNFHYTELTPIFEEEEKKTVKIRLKSGEVVEGEIVED